MMTQQPIVTPWDQEMDNLARYLRSRGRDVPVGASVRLVPVPEHLRDEEGKPLFRIAVDYPSGE